MRPFITTELTDSIMSVFVSFDREIPLSQLEDLGWRMDPDGWLILEITDTVSLQACPNGEDVDMEVWVDDWTFGSVKGIHVVEGHRFFVIDVDDGSSLVYPIVQDGVMLS